MRPDEVGKLDLTFMVVQSEDVEHQHRDLKSYDEKWSLSEAGSSNTCALVFTDRFPKRDKHLCTVEFGKEPLTQASLMALQNAVTTETSTLLAEVSGTSQGTLTGQSTTMGVDVSIQTDSSNPSTHKLKLYCEYDAREATRPAGTGDHHVIFQLKALVI